MSGNVMSDLSWAILAFGLASVTMILLFRIVGRWADKKYDKMTHKH